MAQSRSSLEGKDKQELLDLPKEAGIKTSGRSSREHLIDLLAGEGGGASDTPARESTPRVRRTVSSEDFEGLDETPVSAATESSATDSDDSGERRSDRSPGQGQGRPDRPSRNDRGERGDFDSNNRRNRNRNRGRGRGDRFDREPQRDGGDQPYTGELIEVEGTLDLRDDGYGFLRVNGYNQIGRAHV